MKKNKKQTKRTAAKAVKKAKKTVKRAVKPVKRSVKAAAAAKKTNSSAKALSAFFTKTEIGEIKNKLDTIRQDLSKNVEDKRILDMLDPEVGDSIDQATQSLDKEILFELSDNERKMLDSIDAALRKIDNGIYGVCEHCKNPIEKKRLKALPSARYCLPCQSGTEKSRIS